MFVGTGFVARLRSAFSNTHGAALAFVVAVEVLGDQKLLALNLVWARTNEGRTAPRQRPPRARAALL